MKLFSIMHEGSSCCCIRLTKTRALIVQPAFELAIRRNLLPTSVPIYGSGTLSFLQREVQDDMPYTRLLWQAGLDGKLDEATVHIGMSVFLNPLHGQKKNIFCVGRNYLEHVAEGDRIRGQDTVLPDWPTFFTKPATAFTGPDHVVYIPREVSEQMDYEVELGVIIGRGGRDIRTEDAMDHVFGYTIVNDLSARDLQKKHNQWFKGKSLDASCPVGPWIVHKELIPDPHALDISLLVNGVLRQQANTAQMIFKIPEIISSLSHGMRLETGDLIATGTPAGVGFAMDPPRYLQHGDGIRCEIEKIGRLSNFYQNQED